MKPGDAVWRNVHTRDMDYDTLDQMVVDAVRSKEIVFHLLHGHRSYRWFAPDNSVRVASYVGSLHLPSAVLVKDTSIERLNPPAKGDVVHFWSDNTYGRILWRDDQEVGILEFKTKKVDTWDIDLLETVRGVGNVRWRLYT